MKKLILFFAFSCITITSQAQLNEFGVFFGGSNYIGDVGSEYYINPSNFMGGIIFKRNINPRIALRGTFTYAKLSADDAKSSNLGRRTRAIHFNNNLKELAVGLEFNFFEYNLDDYRKIFTPYVLVEFAAFNYNVVDQETYNPALTPPYDYTYKSKTSIALPFGVGIKTKLLQSFAIALEVRARYTFVDNLDFNKPNTNNLTFGNPKSNDWYVLTGVSIVYTFGRPPCYSTPY